MPGSGGNMPRHVTLGQAVYGARQDYMLAYDKSYSEKSL